MIRQNDFVHASSFMKRTVWKGKALPHLSSFALMEVAMVQAYPQEILRVSRDALDCVCKPDICHDILAAHSWTLVPQQQHLSPKVGSYSGKQCCTIDSEGPKGLGKKPQLPSISARPELSFPHCPFSQSGEAHQIH